MLKFDVKFDDKKIKSAVMQEAEKAAAKKIASRGPITQKRAETVCKNCKTKFFVPIADGICPRCKMPLD